MKRKGSGKPTVAPIVGGSSLTTPTDSLIARTAPTIAHKSSYFAANSTPTVTTPLKLNPMPTNPTPPAQIAPTPTPWKLWNNGFSVGFGPDTKHPVGKFFLDPNNPRAVADAEFALRAINSHAATLDALENAANAFQLLASNLHRQTGDLFATLADCAKDAEMQARAALAKGGAS